MKTEQPRRRLVVLAKLLGITIAGRHTSRGGQVTKAFFREVADAVKIHPSELTHLDKIGLCAHICSRLGSRFNVATMTSRGARITDVWFEDVIERLRVLRQIFKNDSSQIKNSKLKAADLEAHLLFDTKNITSLPYTVDTECYSCGDQPGLRLGYTIIEPHCILAIRLIHSLAQIQETLFLCVPRVTKFCTSGEFKLRSSRGNFVPRFFSELFCKKFNYAYVNSITKLFIA